jgi:ABC-type cobalamin/Fe3+-siderophores transport system ATPase subunit
MITVDRVCKAKGRTQILYGVTFEARPGRVTGFLGPNGAGKTSTLRILLGLDRPLSGTALIGGRPYRSLHRPLTTVGACSTAAVRTGPARPAPTCAGSPPATACRLPGSMRCSTSLA